MGVRDTNDAYFTFIDVLQFPLLPVRSNLDPVFVLFMAVSDISQKPECFSLTGDAVYAAINSSQCLQVVEACFWLRKFMQGKR